MSDQYMADRCVLFMAGGTGGHVYPALTIADTLAQRGARIHWLGNAEGFEGRAVADAGYVLHDIRVRGLRGNGLLGWLQAPWMITRAIWRARRVMRAIAPDVVIGMGGFAAGPGGVAARLAGIPLIIHEQNAVMGLTNRLLARIADAVLLADGRAAQHLPSKKAYQVVGNPVRASILQCSEPQIRYTGRDGVIRLLVLGGSQGAKAINEALPQALALLPVNERPQVCHQVGRRWVDSTCRAYAQQGVHAEVIAFIDDMADALAQCDWVLCRAGALTVAELAAVGVPAVFVPLPHAVDDHQTANASVLAAVGAATILPQDEMNPPKLAEVMRDHMARTALLKQAEAARSCAKMEATRDIIQCVEQFL